MLPFIRFGPRDAFFFSLWMYPKTEEFFRKLFIAMEKIEPKIACIGHMSLWRGVGRCQCHSGRGGIFQWKKINE